jgi:hypothetical protein
MDQITLCALQITNISLRTKNANSHKTRLISVLVQPANNAIILIQLEIWFVNYAQLFLKYQPWVMLQQPVKAVSLVALLAS